MDKNDEIGRYQLQVAVKYSYQFETIFDTKKGEIVSRKRISVDDTRIKLL